MHHHEEDLEDHVSDRRPQVVQRLADESQDDPEYNGEDEVRRRSRRSHDGHAPLPVLEVVRRDRDRLRPAEHGSEGQVRDDEHQRADGVQLFQRIEAQPPHRLGRGVTHAVGDPAMRHFMCRE